MQVIFLDIDGVLNYNDYFNNNYQGIDKYIDRKKLLLIKKIIYKTNCKIVFTSSWRYSLLFSTIEKSLIKEGIIFDKTPYINNDRGIEIKEYLKIHPNIKDFIIIDDDIFSSYDKYLLSKLVKTNIKEGLTEKYSKDIIKKLTKE